MMRTEPQGYTWTLAHGWRLTVSACEAETVAWLVNDGLEYGFYETVVTGWPGAALGDMDRFEYRGAVYHDGDRTPPAVIFRHPDRLGPAYMLAPATGTFAELEGV